MLEILYNNNIQQLSQSAEAVEYAYWTSAER